MYQTSFTSLIVTYNSANEVLNLLADLDQYVSANKVIIIDNASKDKTVNLIQKHHPWVQLIKNPTNVGYAKAVNQGVDLCDTEYVLLLNPDIRISSSQFSSETTKYMSLFNQTAAVAPLQFKDDEKKCSLNFTWSYLNPQAFRVYLSYLLQRKRTFIDPIKVTFLNAGCLFIRRSAFEHVGKLNEKYFMYGEEPDLFLKFRRYGFKCYLLPNTAVTHYRERSLRTIRKIQFLWLKCLSAWNVTDAFVTGWIRILLDKFAVRNVQPVKGNK